MDKVTLGTQSATAATTTPLPGDIGSSSRDCDAGSFASCSMASNAGPHVAYEGRTCGRLRCDSWEWNSGAPTELQTMQGPMDPHAAKLTLSCPSRFIMNSHEVTAQDHSSELAESGPGGALIANEQIRALSIDGASEAPAVDHAPGHEQDLLASDNWLGEPDVFDFPSADLEWDRDYLSGSISNGIYLGDVLNPTPQPGEANTVHLGSSAWNDPSPSMPIHPGGMLSGPLHNLQLSTMTMSDDCEPLGDQRAPAASVSQLPQGGMTAGRMRLHQLLQAGIAHAWR